MSDIPSPRLAPAADTGAPASGPAARPQELGHILDTAAIAEAASRAAYVVLADTKGRLRRTEAALALVMTAFMALDDERCDFVRFRLAQELRRMAAIPAAAAEIAGCEHDDVDPSLLTALASHVFGEASGDAWAPIPPSASAMQ
ncbi:hypothetical protein ACO2Q3_10950 [Caulobacter sp. KR2-114]|uniref:hypothetical protein n=1 Tax=Caulobacter sp. KR2-114 TaxID=3400912 RepID=UPI003C09619D